MVEDVLFLACFLGMPVAMLAAILWLIVGALQERRKRRALGWAATESAPLSHAIQDFPTLGSLTLSNAVRRDGALAAIGRSTGRGGNSELRTTSTVCILFVPVGSGTELFIRHRVGGILGWLVQAAVPQADAPDHWDWAFLNRVPDPSWDGADKAESLRQFLQAGDNLYLTPDYAVLTRSGDALSRLLQRRHDLEHAVQRVAGNR